MSLPNYPAAARLQQLLGERYLDEPARIERYELLERGPRGHTAAVLLPQTEAEVGEILRICNELRTPLVISGGRTGLVEAQRPLGEPVLSLERLNRPLSFALADGREFVWPAGLGIDGARDALLAWWDALGQPATAGASITVEAGLAVDALNDLLRPLQLMFPMAMGSTSSASVGACAANASAGANALCYGTAAHMSEAAWGFWGKGEPAGPCHAAPWAAPDPQAFAINSAHIEASWGLLGSQGAFGLITHLRLRTYAIPAQREAALIPVADMVGAMRVLAAARQRFGADVEEFEFISRSAMVLVRELQGEAFRLPFAADVDSPLYLLLQIKSGDADADLAGSLYEFLAGDLALPDEHIGYAPLPALKKIRHSITEASNARMRALGGGRLSFDTATPLAGFGEYLDAMRAELASAAPDAELVAFGHAGVGGAHLHVLGTGARPISAVGKALSDLVIDVTLAHQGSFSAEHGIGSKWADEYLSRTPPQELAEVKALKRRYDPNNILNPRSFGFDRLLIA
ncbi:MAG: FAD/FMN-containing dehydrogenase [Hydrocarboniphaga sp.]|uniref:FAD-binding oxidoreductase n=1 Tax=Hydrocarboniphaga sp. TaxID=2033016 RepID=UPI0026393D53|nr:FAD-binding oxidoreductase [Hydrocarboniphaga sp.]MDB5971863.1 FAD/FMN-containing dehydrogenase [Hydrocarboniphaga sp.]